MTLKPRIRLGSAGAQGVRVVDRVATRERGHDEREQLVADVRPAGSRAEVEPALDELLETQVLGERGRQEEPGTVHQLRLVERHPDSGRGCGKIASCRCSSAMG